MFDTLVRVVLEYQEDGGHRLKTSGLASFAAALGEDVLVQYCRCYIHTERLESLISMLHSSHEKQGYKGTAGTRLYLTFLAFSIGTLFEAKAALSALRTALVKRETFDAEEWRQGLQKWLDWSDTTPLLKKIRDKATFHIDADWIRDGLRALADGDPPFSIVVSDSRKARDSHMTLAHEAMMVGSDEAKAGFLDAIDVESEFDLVTLKDKLNESFFATLERSGLKPLIVKCPRVETQLEEFERAAAEEAKGLPSDANTAKPESDT